MTASIEIEIIAYSAGTEVTKYDGQKMINRIAWNIVKELERINHKYPEVKIKLKYRHLNKKWVAIKKIS